MTNNIIMGHPDIPFSSDDAHDFLPWIIGVMTCMAALLLCLGLTAGSWITDRHDSYSNQFTVNIPAGVDDLPAKTTKIEALLQTYPGVTGMERLSDNRLRDMLKPWLGHSDAIEGLPMPVVLDVMTDGINPIDYKALQLKLGTIAAGTEVDAHERWVASFASFSSVTQYIIIILSTLIMGALALMIAFTSRTALKLHARTVQLLHSIGAEDGYIANQFQGEAFLLTLRGTAPGCITAGIIYWLVGYYVASLHASILPSLSMTGSHLLLLLAMPFLCGGVAWLAARLTVLRQLQQAL